MKSISLRNVPDTVYSTLQEMARANHRSLQEQIKYILEQEVGLAKGSPLAAAANCNLRQTKDHAFRNLMKLNC